MLQIGFAIPRISLFFEGPSEILRAVEALLEWFPSASEDRIDSQLNARVTRQGRSFAVSLEAEDRLDRFELDEPVQVFGLIYAWLLDNLAPADSKRLGFHAATVASPTRTVMLPAPAKHGKSTLALALAARGNDVLCDELTVLDRSSGYASPLPLAIGCRADTFRLLQGRLPAPIAEIGGVRLFRVAEPGPPLPLTTVVIVEKPGPGGFCGEPHLNRLTCTEGVIESLRQLRAPDALAHLFRSEEHGFGGLVTGLAKTLKEIRFYSLAPGRLDPMVDAIESVLNDE